MEGIALTQSEPAPKTYGIGWESIRINGHRLVNHDGGTANFQASVFFDSDAIDPVERVGVFVAANVVSALDTFSSPPGSSPLDGPTARAMAQSILSLASGRPLPDQGPGNLRLTLIFDLVILALTSALVLSLKRIPRRYYRLAQHSTAGWPGLAWRSGLAAGLNFPLPVVVLYLALKVPAWKVLGIFQPDLFAWLKAVAGILFFKGLFELALIRHVLRSQNT